MQDEESKRGNNTFLNTGFGAPCALQCALVFTRPFSRRAPVGPVTPFLTSAIPGLRSALEQTGNRKFRPPISAGPGRPETRAPSRTDVVNLYIRWGGGGGGLSTYLSPIFALLMRRSCSVHAFAILYIFLFACLLTCLLCVCESASERERERKRERE
jgi:hypothetical protein